MLKDVNCSVLTTKFISVIEIVQFQQSNKNLRILKARVNMNNTPKPHRFWPGFLYLVLTAVFYECYFYFMNITRKHFTPETLKYWVGVQWGQSYLMERRCLFNIGWSLFEWWYHDKNTLLGWCFITSTSLAPDLFLLAWLKLSLVLFLDQLGLAQGDKCWW